MVRRKKSLHPPDTELYASENSSLRNNSSESLKGRLNPSNRIATSPSLSISVSPHRDTGKLGARLGARLIFGRSCILPPCEASTPAAIVAPATTAAPTPPIELVAAKPAPAPDAIAV